MEENEESILDFFSILSTIIPDSYEFNEANKKQVETNNNETLKRKIEDIIDNIKLKCSLNNLLNTDHYEDKCTSGDDNYDEINAVKRYFGILERIPEIHEVREAMSSGCLDQEDFEVIIIFFKSLIELCKPENITIMLCKNSDNSYKQNYQLESPINNITDGNRNSNYKKNSIFPYSIRVVFSEIARSGNAINSGYLLFQICNYIVETLLDCDWNDNNILSWFSRPALSDLLITLSCNEENEEESTNKGEITCSKKQSCNGCHIKSVVLSSILTRMVEMLKIIEKSDNDCIITVNLLDNVSLCFSITFHLISQYHPNCYNIQLNYFEDNGFKSWWSIKPELFSLIQFNNSEQKSIRNSSIYQLSKFFFSQLDSYHLNLKRMSTKGHLIKNMSHIRPTPPKYFYDSLYANIKLDFPDSLFGLIHEYKRE